MVTTTRDSVTSLIVRVLGTETSMPDCSTGAASMKITSSTSTTSTSGVMLISAREDWVRPLLLVKAISDLSIQGAHGPLSLCLRGGGSLRDFLQRIQQFTGEIVDSRGEDPQSGSELVVSYASRHGHEDARGGRNQGF